MHFARTCVLALLGGGVLVTACGHLSLEEVPLEPGPFLDAQTATDSGTPDTSDAPRDGGFDGSFFADAGCGLGCIPTYVSGLAGKDTNDGTAAAPVQTIAQGLKLAAARGGKQLVAVAATHYPEKVTLVEGVSMLGGFACASLPCGWERDLGESDTSIDNPDFEGVLAPSTVTRATRIDGFRIVGKAGKPSGGTTLGSIAMTLLGGSPSVVRCRIEGGDTNDGAASARRSIGVAVLAASNAPAASTEGALLDRNVISAGAAEDESVGVLLGSTSAIAAGGVNAVLTGNRIRGGSAPGSFGVIAPSTGVTTVVHANDIAAGTAIVTPNGESSSWGLVVSGTMVIDANLINVEGKASCPGSTTELCGGIRSVGASLRITNNVVLGAVATRSAAVSFGAGSASAGATPGVVVLNGNTLDGHGSGANESSSTAIHLRNAGAGDVVVGSARNNILLGGVNRTRFAVFEESTPGATAHLSSFTNNDLFYVVRAERSDFAYRVWNGTAASNVKVAELATAVKAPIPASNIAADPLLDATYRLLAGSPCIDKGTAVEAPALDRDEEARPRGAAIDIGADEAK